MRLASVVIIEVSRIYQRLERYSFYHFSWLYKKKRGKSADVQQVDEQRQI